MTQTRFSAPTRRNATDIPARHRLREAFDQLAAAI